MNTQERFPINREMVSFAYLSMAAIIAQLITLIIGFAVIAVFGDTPDNALSYFTTFRENPMAGLFRDEFHLVIMISLYLFSFSGLFFMTKHKHFFLAFSAFLVTSIAVVLNISSHSGFSLMHLSNLYWATSDINLQTKLLTAGEAVIAQNMWNSTSAFFSGIFLQGGGVLMSAAMIGVKFFRKFTWISGLIANGFDLTNHLIHYAFPQIAEVLLFISGPFYIFWFVLMILDLIKFIKTNPKNSFISQTNKIIGPSSGILK